jgi:hypothetical protein
MKGESIKSTVVISSFLTFSNFKVKQINPTPKLSEITPTLVALLLSECQ